MCCTVQNIVHQRINCSAWATASTASRHFAWGIFNFITSILWSTHTHTEPENIQFVCTANLNDDDDDYYYYFNRSNVLIAELVVEFWSNSKYSIVHGMLCTHYSRCFWRAFLLHFEICSANHFISHSFKAIILLIIIISSCSPNRLTFYHSLWP